MNNIYASHWYKEEYNKHEALFGYLKTLENEQSYISSNNLRHLRLYSESEYNSLSSFTYARVEPALVTQNRVTFNVVQSMIDTAVSKITKNKPRPYFLTDGGNWSLKRKAQKLTQFIDGAFYITDYYRKSTTAFKHACIWGTGALKIYRQDNELKLENVLIEEIVVDQKESFYGQPRQIHQKKWINREVLKAMFPKKSTAIDMAISNLTEFGNQQENKADMVLVVESWKLRSGKNKKDGLHGIYISNETLFEEIWTKDYFPFVFFKWNESPIGFFGEGIAKQLTGIQLEMNKILRTIQVSMHLVSVPKLFVEASSKIVASHLNNKIGGIIKYAGTPPTEGKLGTIPPDLFNHLDRLYQRAFSIIGISQLSAQAQKPQGLNSGKALRAYNDIETERFTSVGQDYQNAALQAAKQMIDVIKEIAEETGNFSVNSPGSKFLSKIDWKDVELSETDYIMQCFPISALSQEPAARMQEVQELIQSGMIDKANGLKLLDYPDLRSYYDMVNAGTDAIEQQIELMVDKQEYSSPEPYMNLPQALVTVQNAYLKYKVEGAPEETLELFRRYMDEVNELLAQASAPTPEEQAAMEQQAIQTGKPATPPTAELLPTNPIG